MSAANITVNFEAPNGDYLGKFNEWADKNQVRLEWHYQNIGTQGNAQWQATPILNDTAYTNHIGTGRGKKAARGAAARSFVE